MRPRSLLAAFATALLALAAAASADTGFTVSLNAAQEVPTNASPGTGSGTLIVNNAQTQVTYNITYQNLTSNRTAQHIHGPALPGANAGVLVALAGTGTTSGTISGVATITPTIFNYMLNGMAYVNIHTGNFSAGEIRGQIVASATPARPSTWGRIKRLYH